MTAGTTEVQVCQCLQGTITNTITPAKTARLRRPANFLVRHEQFMASPLSFCRICWDHEPERGIYSASGSEQARWRNEFRAPGLPVHGRCFTAGPLCHLRMYDR